MGGGGGGYSRKIGGSIKKRKRCFSSGRRKTSKKGKTVQKAQNNKGIVRVAVEKAKDKIKDANLPAEPKM